MAVKDQLYYYKAKVVSVYDGDTCTVDIDLGLRTWIRGEKVRLARINAPELKGDEKERGVLSRDYLKALIEGKDVYLHTQKDRVELYGRYIAEVFVEQNGNLVNVNDLLVQNNYAVYATYR